MSAPTLCLTDREIVERLELAGRSICEAVAIDPSVPHVFRIDGEAVIRENWQIIAHMAGNALGLGERSWPWFYRRVSDRPAEVPAQPVMH